MKKRTMPIGVKIARIVNIIQAVFSAAIIIFFLFICVACVIWKKLPPIDVAQIIICILIVCSALFSTSIWLITNLEKLVPSARIMQIVVSVISCFISISFLLPIGQLLPIGLLFLTVHGFVLYCMFRMDTKKAFGVSVGALPSDLPKVAEITWTKQNRKNLTIWILCGILGLVIFIGLYKYTWIEASIDLRVGRKKAIEIADTFLKSKGFNPDKFQKSVIFYGHDDEYKTGYLQKAVGIRRAIELLKSEIPCWGWNVRYYKELEYEGFRFSIDPPTGKIFYFQHDIHEWDKGADLTQDDAKKIAEDVLPTMGEELSGYKLIESHTKTKKNRTDHEFAWSKKEFRVGDAELKIEVGVEGDRLKNYEKYLKIPADFIRDLAKKETTGSILWVIANYGRSCLVIASFFCLVVLARRRKIRWALAFWFSLIPAIFYILYFFNGLPQLWYYYITTESKIVYFFLELAEHIESVCWYSFFIFFFCAAGEVISRSIRHKSMPIMSNVLRKKLTYLNVLPRIAIGYSLGFMMLGYVTIFYLIAMKLFNVWSSINPDYSDMLGTAMPFLYPLTVAARAAVSEEFRYRLFAISFFRKYSRELWLAILIPALIWAFGHAGYFVYPKYVRAIELTIVGIALGIVYLKYGIETVITSHYVYNAVIVGELLLRSHNPYFVMSGVIVIALLFLPALLLPLFIKRSNIACAARN